MRSINDILAAAGGPSKISHASRGKVSVDAIYKWPKIGIPEKHWLMMISLAGSSADELFAANTALRRRTAARRRSAA